MIVRKQGEGSIAAALIVVVVFLVTAGVLIRQVGSTPLRKQILWKADHEVKGRVHWREELPVMLYSRKANKNIEISLTGSVCVKGSHSSRNIFAVMSVITLEADAVLTRSARKKGLTFAHLNDDNRRSTDTTYRTAFRSEATNLFLCMDKDSIVYASRNLTNDCHWHELRRSDFLTVFQHAKHHWKRRHWYLAFDKLGNPVPGNRTSKHQKRSHFVQKPVLPNTLRALKLYKAANQRHNDKLCKTNSAHVSNQTDKATVITKDIRARIRRKCSIRKNPRRCFKRRLRRLREGKKNRRCEAPANVRNKDVYERTCINRRRQRRRQRMKNNALVNKKSNSHSSLHKRSVRPELLSTLLSPSSSSLSSSISSLSKKLLSYGKSSSSSSSSPSSSSSSSSSRNLVLSNEHSLTMSSKNT